MLSLRGALAEPAGQIWSGHDLPLFCSLAAAAVRVKIMKAGWHAASHSRNKKQSMGWLTSKIHAAIDGYRSVQLWPPRAIRRTRSPSRSSRRLYPSFFTWWPVRDVRDAGGLGGEAEFGMARAHLDLDIISPDLKAGARLRINQI